MSDGKKLSFAKSILTSVGTEPTASLEAANDRLALAFGGISATGVITWAKAPITSDATAGLGYAAGAGGAVTQATNKTTGVTLSKPTGVITMNNAALAAAAEVAFTVTNTLVAATDIPVVAIASVGTTGSYLVSVSAVAAGSFDITVTNASAGSLSEAIVINFAIIKGVSA